MRRYLPIFLITSALLAASGCDQVKPNPPTDVEGPTSPDGAFNSSTKVDAKPPAEQQGTTPKLP